MQTLATEQGFKVIISARIRHGLLWQARTIFGSNQKFAAYLGVNNVTLGSWINLKSVPNKSTWSRIENKMAKLGHLREELFPPNFHPSHLKRLKIPRTIEVERIISLDVLQFAGGAPRALPLPDEIIELKELCRDVVAAVQTLTPRERHVIKRRFEDECSQAQISEEMGVGRQRISQIEMKALRKLRHPRNYPSKEIYLKGRLWRADEEGRAWRE